MLERAHADVVRVVGEAETVRGAAELARTADADVVFLDIQLDGESGLDLLEHLDPSVAVVFVTAYDRYAVRAFEVNALDYLLKPVAPARLARAVARLGTQPAEAPATPGAGRLEPDDRLFLRLGERMGFLRIAAIASIVADGDYTALRTADGRTVRVRTAIRDWEDRLPAHAFVRVHRSAIVNLDHVERVEEWSHFSYHLHVKGSTEPIVMSRRYAAQVRARLR